MGKVIGRLGRTIFVIAVAVLFLCGAGLALMASWRQQDLTALAEASQMVDLSRGPMEFTDRGEGPVVLVIHGAPGGYDQAELLGESLLEAGFRVIAPSRPGFLRTPLTTGILFEEQADALAELLDALEISDAAVVAFSTGAPAAMQLAARHPGRVQRLALISPVTKPYLRGPESPELIAEYSLLGLGGDLGSWLAVELSKHDPARVIDAILSRDTTLDEGERNQIVEQILADPSQLLFFQKLIATQSPLSAREPGIRNDMAMLASMHLMPQDEVTVPILVIEGTADSQAEFVAAAEFVEKQADAEVVEVEDAGHIVWLSPGAAAMDERILFFLGATEPPLPRE